jgi:hypothetical protein
MTRVLSIAILASAASFAIAPPIAWAVSPSQEQCEAAGGEFDRVQGEAICTEEGKNPKFTSTTSGRGNIGNKTSGPDCEGTGSNKCPPGQF